MISRGSWFVILAVALMTVPSMGCLDVQLWKTLINGPDVERIGYEDVDGPTVYWKYNIDAQDLFDMILRGEDPTKLTDHEETHNFRVREGTTRLVLSYNLSMDNPGEAGWNTIQAILEELGQDDGQIGQFLEIIKDLDRHLEIWLMDQDRNEMAYRRHNETIDGIEQVFILDPVPGTWSLRVKSRGFGFEDPVGGGIEYHDEYTVTSILRQPVFKNK